MQAEFKQKRDNLSSSLILTERNLVFIYLYVCVCACVSTCFQRSEDRFEGLVQAFHLVDAGVSLTQLPTPVSLAREPSSNSPASTTRLAIIGVLEL